MNKNEEDKIINAIIDLHQEIKGMGKEIKDLRSDMDKRFAKINLTLGEMRLSYMKLDASFNKYALRNDERANNHETRIKRLEDKTGSSYIARERTVKYKRAKKK